jgi:hypothetical protein
VVLPELALTAHAYNRRRGVVAPRSGGAKSERTRFLLAGIGAPAKDGQVGANDVRLNLFQGPALAAAVDFEQRKHHRWQLDGGQMDLYGLAKEFDRKRLYWECVGISNRNLNFLSVHPLLTIAVLVCEDLARPDPVADVIRAVGPNLVIALLADAPQLTGRWSGRYATSLAWLSWIRIHQGKTREPWPYGLKRASLPGR